MRHKDLDSKMKVNVCFVVKNIV